MKIIAESRGVSLRIRAGFLLAFSLFVLNSLSVAYGQGSRKDDVVFGPSGRPVAGATVQVCQPAATGTPCSPLATIYTDATLTVSAPNPFQTDGLGNYHFYAPAGRYQVQISSPQINGTITQPDVILPPDLSSSGAGNNISAFGLTLGGNLTVAGNASISGTLSSSSFNPGPLSSLTVSGNASLQGPRPYIDVTAPAYGASGDGGAESTTGSISSGSKALTVANATGFKAGMGVHVDGAGASGDVLLAKINSISGLTLNLSVASSTTVTNAAVGDDDTLAIQQAMAAFCGGGNSGGGSVYFPPGSYIFSQNQSVNANAVPFTIGCQSMHFLGGAATNENTGTNMPPAVSVNGHCGPSMNAQPVFLVAYPNQNATFENLIINGCNEAMSAPGQWLHLINTTLAVGATGLTDNTPLHIWDTFNIRIDGGGLVTNGTNAIPTLLMTGDACSGCYVGVGNVYITHTFFDGGGVQYIQRANQSGANPGNWVFRNTIWESGNGPFLTITDTGGFTIGGVQEITMDAVQIDDDANANAPLINLNIPSQNFLTGLRIMNSNAASATAPAVTVTSGHVDTYYISGCSDGGGCANNVVNSSGLPIGSGVSNSRQGLDILTDTSLDAGANLITNPPQSLGNFRNSGPAIRITKTGSNYSSLMLDANAGLGFAASTQSGWNAQVYQDAAPNIAIAFAANYPPTGVAAAPSNSGGSLPTGTYYIWMVSTTTNSCSSNTGNFSGASPIAGPYSITGSTGSLGVTWTPAAAGLTGIQGYCVFANSINQYNYNSGASALVAGASTSSATITSFPSAPGDQPITGTMVPVYHFTPTSASLPGATFNGLATPLPSAAPPYTPSCIAAVTCSGFMALSTTVNDSFTRANASTLGSNWSPAIATSGWTALQIVSNTAEAPGGNPGFQSWVSQAFLADQFAKATVGTFGDGSSDQAGVGVRGSGTSTDTEYIFQCYNGSSIIVKRVAGTQTNLASGGGNCATGNTIELDVVGTQMFALINGTVTLSATDSSISSGYPGVFAWGGDNVTNFVGGSLPAGNGTQAIFDQANTWVKPQTFISPITSASLAAPNKTGTCNIVRGDQSGSALTTGNIQPQGSLCYVDTAATVTQVIVMVDAGASTVQVGYRHNGSTTAISPTLTPASVSGITDHVACANAAGTAITIEGNSVTCSTLSNTTLTLGDFIETTGGAADGTSKRISIALTYTIN